MSPILDFAALQAAPLKPAVTLPGLEHPAFPSVLAAAMPGVRHSRTSWPDDQDEHSLVDPETGSAVRIVITWDRRQGRARTCIAEIGTRKLWDELVGRLGEWERHSRTIPEHWQEGAQRAALPTSQETELPLRGAHSRIGRLEGGNHLPASSFELAVPRQLPTRPVAASEVDLQVRDELDAVAVEQEHAVVALLAGEQGITNSVALDWIHANSDDYDHGQLYADLDHGDAAEPASPSQVLGKWLEALGQPTADIPDELRERTLLFRSMTSQRRIAVLLENAISAAQVRPLLPNSDYSLTVVTSRRLLVGLRMDGARLIDAGTAHAISGSLGVAR
ncbi:hypothetical protein [Saccharopolyspora taberi]|uniref:Uncharacterized protein n=1 Tax=Saccharopolyspora taberi TaxID=60895 RepID=A0ABN3VF04_9PSEU